jgi:hypothetical protein
MSLPHVGIWRDDGSTIVALPHKHSENTTCIGGHIDSNLAHVDAWPSIAAQLGRNGEDEYFCVPRDRVLWDATNQRGIILHGPATIIERLKLIAQRFNLGEDWNAETDCHYFTGDDADSLFDDED